MRVSNPPFLVREPPCTMTQSAKSLEVSFVVVLIFAGRGDLFLEVVDGLAGLGHEASHVLGHLGQRAGAEDHEDDEANNHHLLGSDAEHTTEYNPRARTLQTAETPQPLQRIYSLHVVLYERP